MNRRLEISPTPFSASESQHSVAQCYLSMISSVHQVLQMHSITMNPLSLPPRHELLQDILLHTPR